MREELAGAIEQLGVERERSPSSRLRGDDALAGELQHPAHVGARHVLPGAAKAVRAQDVARGERAFDRALGRRRRPQGHGPQRAEMVLRLHGAEPAHHLHRRRQRMVRDELATQSLRRRLRQLHGRTIDDGRARPRPDCAPLAADLRFRVAAPRIVPGEDDEDGPRAQTSPLVRGVLTAIFWIQTLPNPYTIVGTLREAEAWAREQLRAAGLGAP